MAQQLPQDIALTPETGKLLAEGLPKDGEWHKVSKKVGDYNVTAYVKVTDGVPGCMVKEMNFTKPSFLDIIASGPKVTDVFKNLKPKKKGGLLIGSGKLFTGDGKLIGNVSDLHISPDTKYAVDPAKLDLGAGDFTINMAIPAKDLILDSGDAFYPDDMNHPMMGVGNLLNQGKKSVGNYAVQAAISDESYFLSKLKQTLSDPKAMNAVLHDPGGKAFAVTGMGPYPLQPKDGDAHLYMDNHVYQYHDGAADWTIVEGWKAGDVIKTDLGVEYEFDGKLWAPRGLKPALQPEKGTLVDTTKAVANAAGVAAMSFQQVNEAIKAFKVPATGIPKGVGNHEFPVECLDSDGALMFPDNMVLCITGGIYNGEEIKAQGFAAPGVNHYVCSYLGINPDLFQLGITEEHDLAHQTHIFCLSINGSVIAASKVKVTKAAWMEAAHHTALKKLILQKLCKNLKESPTVQYIKDGNVATLNKLNVPMHQFTNCQFHHNGPADGVLPHGGTVTGKLSGKGPNLQSIAKNGPLPLTGKGKPIGFASKIMHPVTPMDPKAAVKMVLDFDASSLKTMMHGVAAAISSEAVSKTMKPLITNVVQSVVAGEAREIYFQIKQMQDAKNKHGKFPNHWDEEQHNQYMQDLAELVLFLDGTSEPMQMEHFYKALDNDALVTWIEKKDLCQFDVLWLNMLLGSKKSEKWVVKTLKGQPLPTAESLMLSFPTLPKVMANIAIAEMQVKMSEHTPVDGLEVKIDIEYTGNDIPGLMLPAPPEVTDLPNGIKIEWLDKHWVYCVTDGDIIPTLDVFTKKVASGNFPPEVVEKMHEQLLDILEDGVENGADLDSGEEPDSDLGWSNNPDD